MDTRPTSNATTTRTRRHGIGLLCLALPLCAGAAAGCAEEREPINRVQANALAKSFFVGPDLQAPADDPEFYSAATIVDVPYGADNGGVFAGLVGMLQRVKWEIAEDTLNARLTYESADGVDGHGARTTNNGEVVAAYEIDKHFDIKRAYNPSTGEELNVIEENETDRPWYQREYMRVNWSKNLVSSSRLWDPLAGDDYEVEDLAYYVSDPNSPDAPVFSVADGYFDVTNKVHIKPLIIDLGYGAVPACFYRGSLVVGASYPWGNCENSEVTVRYSFRRVGQRGEPGFTDYEPIDWDGSRMTAFGVFTQNRIGFDRNYGIVDDKYRRFAQRYNIWQQSHSDAPCATRETYLNKLDPTRDGEFYAKDEEGNQVLGSDGKPIVVLGPDGTDDECETVNAEPNADGSWTVRLEHGVYVDGKLVPTAPGSRCSELVGRCTIPYARRELRPVPWHYTVNMEDRPIFESTQHATWQWDAAVRTAVQAARYSECMRTGTASLTGTRWQAAAQPGADFAAAREACAKVFPIDQSHDDAELDRVREVNICVEQGKSRAACSSGLDPNSVAAMEPMVVLCANPVRATDHPACGPAGTVVRPGDIRYHQVNLWPTPETSSPWGYGPSLGDPLTGEIISANINVYNSVTDTAAQTFLNQIRWMNGEITAEIITSGKHVHDWVQAGGYAKAQAGPLMTEQEVQQRISGITGLTLEDVQKAPELAKQFDMSRFAKMYRDLEREIVPPGVIPEDRSEFEARIQKAKDTGVEAELIGPMWLQMAGVSPDLPYEKQLEMASPLRGMNSHVLLRLYDEAQKKLADKGQCLLGAPEPTGIPAAAAMMKRKFPFDAKASAAAQHERLQKMWDFLRTRMNYTVILHEMGHTIGLRHNFVSSYDKYNYKTQYWQLRTDTGNVTKLCKGLQEDGAACIGPRYYDPLTQDEIDGSIWTWMNSSIMDYPGDVTQDMLGLSIYDLAATRMFYAGTVDVRDDGVFYDPTGESFTTGDAVKALVDYPGYIFGQTANYCPEGKTCSCDPKTGNCSNWQTVPHYSFYNQVFKLVQPERCAPVDPQPPSWWREADWGAWDPLWDGQVVHGERCARPAIDYVQWADMVPDQITVDFDDPRFFTPRRAGDRRNRPRVPYAFMSDEWADGWSPSAYRHDNGADMYEEMVFHTNLYENRHIFDNFRNGRVNFTVYGAYQRALSRYHVKIENLTQGFAYSVAFILRQFAKDIGASFAPIVAYNTGPGSFLYDHAVAASVGFDHFARVLTRPHRGLHYCPSSGLGCNPNSDRILMPAEDVFAVPPAGSALVGFIPNGNMIAGSSVSYGGRPVNNDFQYAHGYWTIDYLNQAGSYYEKTYAMEAMLNAAYGAINFWRWDGIDARFRHINFADLYPDGMRRLIGVALTEDYQLLGPRIGSDDKGRPAFAPLGPAQANKPPYCGDGVLQPQDGEECEDGNKKDGDACSSDCRKTWPASGMAWVSYVPQEGPLACAPVGQVMACVDTLGNPIANGASDTEAWFVDPQLGYEVQKFIAFWFYVYQPGKEILDWVDLARVYRLGSDLDPDYLPEQRVEWEDPETGLRYLAKRFGDEQIFGKTYDKGIAAKMIQWANHLTSQAYLLDPEEPFDPTTGAAKVLFDEDGAPKVKGGNCDDNKACQQLRKYRGLIDFMRDTAAKLGFPEPALQIFGD